MSDIEKGAGSPGFVNVNLAAPPAYQVRETNSFNGPYEQFVNDNMRNFPQALTAPVQAFDQIETPSHKSKLANRKRQLMYIGIGLLIIIIATLIGYIALSRRHGDKDVRADSTPQLVTVTETSTPSVSVSVSISTLITKTTKLETTTVATTAPIPKSIAGAASSFYAAWSSSVEAQQASDRSAQEAALTKYSESPSTTTVITTATPPPATATETATTVVLTTTTTDDVTSTNDAQGPNTSYRNWVNFCGVPGIFCR